MSITSRGPTLVGKLLRSFKRRGVRGTLDRSWSVATGELPHLFRRLLPMSPVERHRLRLSQRLFRQFRGVVKYGPFKGLRLESDARWGRWDKGSMILGLYEKEILDALASRPETHTTLVDLGAADGYYGVGGLVSGLFDASYCYEVSEVGQRIIAENARRNGVADRVNVFGIADETFYTQLSAMGVDLSTCVLLSDIEGGEFQLFTRSVFEAFKGSILFIEIHHWHDGGEAGLVKLKELASEHFHVTELKTGSRDLSGFPELRTFTDTDRWLICSEGRGLLMTFLRLDPR